MAIVKMNKFTLLAFESQKARILERLQGFAETEFVNLQDASLLEENEVLRDLSKDRDDSEFAGCEEKLSMTKFALEFLKDYIPQKSALKAMKEGKRQLTLKELETEVMSNNWEEVYKKVKEKEEVIASLESEKTKLQSIVESLRPWEGLDVSFEELSSIKTPYFIGSVPKQYEDTLVAEMNDYYLEIISRNNQDICFS